MQLKSFKAQNSCKDVVKIVHVTSVVQPCHKATRKLFVHKEKESDYSREQDSDFVFLFVL